MVNKLKSITLLGSSSGRNAGDAALISCIMEAVDSEVGKDLLYEIPTINPKFVRESYPQRTKPIGMKPWNLSLMMLGFPTMYSLLRTDMSLIFDQILFDRSLYNPFFNYLSSLGFLLPIAKKKGKLVGLYNVGIGPISTSQGERILRSVLDLADFISVRDIDSYQIVKDLGGDQSKLFLGADAAFNSEMAPDNRIDEIYETIDLDPGGEILGINVNAYMDTWVRSKEEQMGVKKFVSIYSAALNKVMSELSVPVLFVLTQHMDIKIANAIMDELRFKDRIRVVSNVTYHHKEIMGVLSRVQMLFGMRLHSLILSSTSCVPVVGLLQQPKIAYFFKILGLSDYVLTFDNFTPESIRNHIMNGWENRHTIKRRLENRIPELKKQSRKVSELIGMLSRGEDVNSALQAVSRDNERLNS
ncbi:MAG: hypothetical protein GTO08_11510 [Deltaproteobacteria bacterium]|nr:hypothetical protein [Deltaproteobacteria bacterium]